MRSLKFVLLTIFVSGLCSIPARSQGFSGTICYLNGSTVNFDYLGDREDIYDSYLYGKLGSKRVRYKLEDLKEVYFLDTNKSYSKERDNWHGTVLIDHRKKDERYTLTDCWVQVGDQSGVLYYVSHDTITKKTYESFADILGTVSHILIGEHSGNFKYNARTKTYFPPSFLYDPYTGEKLIWIKKEN